MIQNILFTQNNTLNFKGRYPARIFRDVRDIPNLTCAKCGNKMLPRLEAENFISKIRPSLKTCLKKLDNIKSAKEYPLLENLAQQYPKDNIDKILLHLHKSPELKQISPLTINSLRAVTYNAPLVIKKLQKYRKYFDSVNSELFDIMTVYAEKYPQNTFAEIISKPEVYEYHKNAVKIEKASIEIKAGHVFDKMEKIISGGKSDIDDNTEEHIARLKITNSEVIRILKNRINQDDNEFLINELYEGIISGITNEKDAEKFRELIKGLPQASLNPHRIIIKAADNNSPLGLIYHLFNKTNTFEHIKPKSQQGKNEKLNGIYMCSDCNTKRGTNPYYREFRMFPFFGINLQKQMSDIIRYIMRGQLINYDFYPQEVKQTLYEETGHLFKLDIKKYLKEQIEKCTSAIQKSRDEIQQNSMLLAENKRKITRLTQEQEKLKNKQANTVTKYIREKDKLQRLEEYLNSENSF